MTTLYGPARCILPVVGQFTVTEDITYEERHAEEQRVFVVKDLQASLPAPIALQLLQRVDTVTKTPVNDDIIRNFSKVFQGLGNIGEEFV